MERDAPFESYNIVGTRDACCDNNTFIFFNPATDVELFVSPDAQWICIDNLWTNSRMLLSVIFSILKEEYGVTHYIGERGAVTISHVGNHSPAWSTGYLNRLCELLSQYYRKPVVKFTWTITKGLKEHD